MKEQKFIDIRTLSLEHIVALKTEKWDRFRETISSSLTGHEFQELKTRLLKAKAPNTDLKIVRHLEYIENVLKHSKESIDAGPGIRKRISDAEEMVKFATKKLEEAKSNLALAEEILQRAKNDLNTHEQEVENTNQLLLQSGKDLQKKKRLILIHPSTSLKQIIQYKDGIFVATKVDLNVLEKIGCIDKVFNEEISFVDVIPENIRSKYSSQELISIISYANMIINIALSEENPDTYKLLYSNKDIDTLLKVNGFEL